MDVPEMKLLWLYMHEVWPVTYSLPTADQDRLRTQVWTDILGDLPAQGVRAAIMAHAEDQFPPAPGKLAATARRLLDDASGHHQPDLDEAWAEVQTMVRLHGLQVTGPIAWSHPSVEAAVAALTWRRLCLDENQTALFAHFAQVFRPAADRTERASAIPVAARDIVTGLAGSLATRSRELEA